MSSTAQACEDYKHRNKNRHAFQRQKKKNLTAITGPRWIAFSPCFSTLQTLTKQF